MKHQLVSGCLAVLAGSAGAVLAQSCTPQWLAGGMPQLNGPVYASIMWDRDKSGPLPASVVVGGSFTLAGSTAVSNLALWDGVEWFDIGGGVSGTLHGTTAINALAVASNGDLLVGGAFDNAGSGGGQVAANCIARYSGTGWSPMGQGVQRFVDTVQSLAVRSNGDIVAVGGLFLNLDNTTTGPLAKWTSSNPKWVDFAATAPAMDAYRSVLSLSSGDLVVGGVAGSSTGNSAVWRWNDAQNAWIGYGSGVNDQVLSLHEASNGDLLIGGNFTNAGGTPANSIARWTGSSFAALGTGITYPSQPFQLAVRAMVQMPNGDLVAGGQFDTAGGNVGGRIARWDGAAWTRLSQGAGDIVWTLLRTPANEVIIGGAYTNAGGSFANKRASRFTDLAAPWAARHPSDVTVAAGLTVAISATPVTQIAGVSYQWRRNGVAIVDGAGGASAGGGVVAGASGNLASPTNGTAVNLTITGATPGDSGTYTVVFTNTCGGGESIPAVVVVTGSTCAADFNGDTVIDFFDYLDFVAEFSSNGANADFNADTVVDFFDYLDFVAAFSTGC